jgi:hypothetical protein
LVVPAAAGNLDEDIGRLRAEVRVRGARYCIRPWNDCPLHDRHMRCDLGPDASGLTCVQMSTEQVSSYKTCYSLHLTHVVSLAVKSQAKLVGQERTLGMRSWPMRTCMHASCVCRCSSRICTLSQ